jgi:precorrin-3B methylase
LFSGADGVVYFYNTASRSSFRHIEAIHDKLEKIKSAPTPSVLVGIVLAGTEQEVSFKEGNELARKWGCDFSVETEATVEDMLSRIIRLCRKARKAQGDGMGVPRWNLWSCLGWR